MWIAFKAFKANSTSVQSSFFSAHSPTTPCVSNWTTASSQSEPVDPKTYSLRFGMTANGRALSSFRRAMAVPLPPRPSTTEPGSLQHRSRRWEGNASSVMGSASVADGLALHKAAERGHVERCRLLLQNGANVNEKAGRWAWTPMHQAAENNHDKVLELLLEYKANVDDKDRFGRTPLHIAVSNGRPATKAVEVLLGNGADVSVFARFLGQYPLHIAAASCCGHADIVALLLKKGACPDGRDSQGNTALAVALSGVTTTSRPADAADIVTVLLEAGSDARIKNELGQAAEDIAEQLAIAVAAKVAPPAYGVIIERLCGKGYLDRSGNLVVITIRNAVNAPRIAALEHHGVACGIPAHVVGLVAEFAGLKTISAPVAREKPDKL